MKNLFLRCVAVLLTGAILVNPAFASQKTPSASSCPANSSLFAVEAITPELVVDPAVPELRAGVHLRSEINYEAGRDESLAQLHGRAAVSLAYDPTGRPGLTDGQMIYGQAHYNVEESINHLLQTLEPGVEAAIRRQLNLNADEPLPSDIGHRVVFIGVGGSGVKNPVAFVGDALAQRYGQRYHPIRKIENASQAGHAKLLLDHPELIKDRTIIWIDNGIMSGRTFLESRQQLLAAGAKNVEPFFLGSAPGMNLSDINWIVGSAATPAPAPFARVVNSGRVPLTPWIDKATQFSGDRKTAIDAFKHLFGGLNSQAKLNVFFNSLERFQGRGLPEKDLLVWMAQLIEQDTNLQPIDAVAHHVAELVSLRIQQNLAGNKKDINPARFSDLAALLTRNENRLPMGLAQSILEEIEERFKITPVETLQEIIANLVAQEGLTVDESAVQIQVKALNGYGLNEVDRDLMNAYFQGSDQLKIKLQIIRDVMFARGVELAEQGMAGTGTILGHPDETPAEAIERLDITFERWRRWALAYGEAYKADHPEADEVNINGDARTDKNAFKGVGRTIADEIDEDTFNPLLGAVDTMKTLIQNDEIRPDKVKLRLGRSQPLGHVAFTDRPARVAFFPMKGDPWQVGHIFMMMSAIATHKLDKVVFMIDNSDPFRKPGLSSLTIREAITRFLLKILTPFIEYTTISKDEADLRDKDGDRSIFRYIELNRGLNVEWFYMAGSDHRHWDKTQKTAEKKQPKEELVAAGKDTTMETGYDQTIYDKHYDVARKEWYFTQIGKPDGYQGEPLRIIFNERHGELFETGWQEMLEALSGIPILTTFQPMDTSSTRIREKGHWWTVPYEVFAMAVSIGFWGAEKASQVAKSVLLDLQSLHASGPRNASHTGDRASEIAA